MTHMLELQLRDLIRENLLAEIISDPLDIRNLRAVIKEQIQSLILEAEGEASFWTKFNWAGLASDLEDALSVIGLIAGGVVVLAGGTAGAPVAAVVITVAGIATMVISVGQAIDKGIKGDIYGVLFEMIDIAMAAIGLKYLSPAVAGPIREKIASVLFEFLSTVMGKLFDYIDNMADGAEEIRRKKNEVQLAVNNAKSVIHSPTAGANKIKKLVTLQQLESRAIELAVDDSEASTPPQTLGDLVLDLSSTFNDIDPRAIEPLSSQLHKIYMDAYASPPGADTQTSTKISPRRKPARVSRPSSETALAATADRSSSEPTEFISDYKFDRDDGELRWTGVEPYMGTVVGNLFNMKLGDKILPTGRITLFRVDIDPGGTAIKNVIVKGVDGNLLKIKSAGA
jgi:hypothetical protein